MLREKTALSGTSCPGSTRKAARCSATNIPVPPNWNTIFSGAPRAICRNGADRHLQPILLRGGTDRPGASRDSAKRSDPGYAASRQEGLARPVSFDRGFGEAPLRQRNRIIKFYLHLSKEEQRKRFLARIDEPDKNWKFSLADIAERKFWKHYMKAYEECLSATSTHHSPWYVVPADDKEKCSVDSIQNCPRYVRRTQNVLPENERKAPSRIAVDPQGLAK